MAGGSSTYQIHVEGILDDSQIRAKLATIESQLNKGGLAAVTGSNGKGKKGGTTVYGQAGKEAKGATKQVAGFAGATKKASVNLLDVGKKVMAFGAVTSAIQLATSGMGDMVNNVFELDEALTEYKKVSDLSTKGLEEMTDAAFKAGKTVARTGTEMVASAAIAKKSGFSDKDAMRLATVAEKFRNVADTELTAEESMGFLVSQIKAFNINAKDAESIIDKVNIVGNNFAVGTGDLQTALSKTSSAMSTYGNDINQTIGIITAGTEVMVGQPAKVARGWRTIGANIVKLADSTDTWSAANGKVSVALKDSQGELRSTYDILKDLAPQWETLSDKEQSSLALSIAGKNQMEVFTATMNNFSQAVASSEKALDAAGSAEQENQKYLDSLEGRVASLKSSWENFSRTMIDTEMVKGTLTALTGLLDFLSTGVGKATMLVTGLGIAWHFVGDNVLLAAGNVKSFFSLMATEGIMKTVMSGIVNPFILAGVAVAGIGAALGGILTIYGKHLEKGDKVLKQQKESVKAVKDWKKAQQATLDIENRIKEKRSELDNLIEKDKTEGLTKAEKDRLKTLQLELSTQEKILAAQREAEGLKWQKKETTLGNKGLNARDFEEMGQHGWTAQETWENRYGVSTKAGKALVQYQKSTEGVTTAKEKLAKVEKQLAKAQEEGQKKGETAEEWNDRVNELTEKQSKLKTELAQAEADAATEVQNMLDKKSEYDKYLENGVELTKEQKEEYNRLCDAIEDYDTLTDLTTTDMEKALKTMTEYGDGMGLIVDESGKVNEIKLDEFSSSLHHAGKTADEVYEYLEAIKEANPDAKITLDGAEVSVGEAQAVLQYLQAIDESNPEATVTIGGVTYATSELQVVDGKLQTLDGTVVTSTITTNDEASGKVSELQGKTDLGKATKHLDQKGYGDVKGKMDTLAKRKDLGTATKTIVEEHVKRAKGDRNFHAFAKGTSNSPSNAIVNEQGFEIIQSPNGAMRIANAGKRGVTLVEEGSAIYTHGQSMRMLARAGLTEADILQGKTGDVGVVGVKKLEGFKKGKKKKARKAFKKELETLEFKRDFENWTDEKFQAEYEKLWDKYGYGFTDKKGNYTKASREYRTELAELSREQATDSIDSMMEIFENQQKTYAEMTTILEQYYEDGKINADEYAEYLKELNEQQVENLRDNYSNQWDYISSYIQRQIDLEEENNDLLEAQAELLSATTQKVKVYKEGIGFVYEADESAVKEAQENLKSYSSVWEQIQGVLDDVEDQIDLKQLATKAGSSLVQYVANAGTDLSSWSNLIKLVGGNMGAYDLASDLGITDPNSITKATTINGQTFNIDNISLPQVTNANEFVSELQTLAIQASASRG